MTFMAQGPFALRALGMMVHIQDSLSIQLVIRYGTLSGGRCGIGASPPRVRIYSLIFSLSSLIPAALGHYFPRVREHCHDLVTQMSKRVGTPVNVSLWMTYFGFDVIGDLTFGNPFNMLKDGTSTPILDLYIKSLPRPAIRRCVPWLLGLVPRPPRIGRARNRMGSSEWFSTLLQGRKEVRLNKFGLFSSCIFIKFRWTNHESTFLHTSSATAAKEQKPLSPRKPTFFVMLNWLL